MTRSIASVKREEFVSGPLAASGETLASKLAGMRFTEMTAEFDREAAICWCWFDFKGRPSFTPDLLEDIGRLQAVLREGYALDSDSTPVKYLVWGSKMPGVWNLGGDLNLFQRLIRCGDKEKLRRYAHKVVGEGFSNWRAMDLPIVTVALIQGDALGGGFEAALSSNVIIAEESAKFGLPEILFGLFPGMGAYSFLARRVDPAQAERMILSGKTYSAPELYELGVIDHLAPDGEGRKVMEDFASKNASKHAAHRAVFKARDRINPVTLEEMIDITDSWVETAMTLSDHDLKKMERLVRAQDRRIAGQARALPTKKSVAR